MRVDKQNYFLMAAVCQKKVHSAMNHEHSIDLT